MKFKIRVILKLFLILVTFIFCVRFYLVRKNLLLNYKLEEKKILSSYEDKKEKYDLVNSLLDDVLVQGEYIDIKKGNPFIRHPINLVARFVGVAAMLSIKVMVLLRFIELYFFKARLEHILNNSTS